MSKTKKTNQEIKEVQVVIDHPAEKEAVSGEEYTFRIKTSDRVTQAEISIDGGPWEACREALGYWWFDWQGVEGGNHQAIARVQWNGQSVVSAPRQFACNARDRMTA